MTRTVICVSHEAGAGGRELAAAVAERLGYRYVDEEVVTRAAERERVSPADLADVERRKSFLSKLLVDFGRSGGARAYRPGQLPTDSLGVTASERLRGAITNAISEIAAEGRVVFVSHAASHALSGDDVLRVLVVAPDQVRIGRLADESDGDAKAAAKAVAESDAARRDYLERFYSIDRESADDYDIVVNTGRIDPASLATVVVAAAEV